MARWMSLSRAKKGDGDGWSVKAGEKLIEHSGDQWRRFPLPFSTPPLLSLAAYSFVKGSGSRGLGDCTSPGCQDFLQRRGVHCIWAERDAIKKNNTECPDE